MHKTGNVVVEGVAIGKIQFLNADYEEQIKRYMTGTEEEEKKRYQEAHTLAKDDLDSLLEDRDSLSESEAEIIEAHQLMIDDITFEDAILGYIEQKMSAPSAVLKAVDDFKAMFEEIGFEGVFEVEFLIDKDGTFYFMETNFRASAWNPTCKFAGMPLPYLWIKGMENGYIDPADRKEFEPFTSMSEVIDYAKRVEGGMCSIAEWLRDFKDAKCVYIYDKEDRGPWDEVIKNWDNFK